MPVARFAVAPGVPGIHLSILYLRCYLETRDSTALLPFSSFNSLFEMPYVRELFRRVWQAYIDLSILYLRCSSSVFPASMSSFMASTFNSLFEMRKLEELIPKFLREIKPFNSLFEMHNVH